jgi:hypothetical protein
LYLVRADLTPTFLAAQAAEASVAARVDQAVRGFDCANFASRAAADSQFTVGFIDSYLRRVQRAAGGQPGLGRIVALYHRSSTLYNIR